MNGASFRLSVPADAAYGTTVRTFVASAARTFLSLPDGSIDDIRLVAHELLANAAAAGEARLELELTSGTGGAEWELCALGAGDLEAVIAIGSNRIRRIDVLRGFSDVRVDDDRVVCSGSASTS